MPLLTGNNKLVGDYGFLIYPKGPSKHFLSKNMMNFWANFAKTGKPGISSNKQEWTKAKKLFKESLSMEEKFIDRPTTPSEVYLDRCDYFKAEPPGKNWDGIWTMKTK